MVLLEEKVQVDVSGPRGLPTVSNPSTVNTTVPLGETVGLTGAIVREPNPVDVIPTQTCVEVELHWPHAREESARKVGSKNFNRLRMNSLP